MTLSQNNCLAITEYLVTKHWTYQLTDQSLMDFLLAGHSGLMRLLAFGTLLNFQLFSLGLPWSRLCTYNQNNTLAFTPKFQLAFYSSQLVIVSQQHISTVALSKIHPVQLPPQVSNPWHIIPTNGFSPVSMLAEFSTREGVNNWTSTLYCGMPGSIQHNASLAVRIGLPNSPTQTVSDANCHWQDLMEADVGMGFGVKKVFTRYQQ